MKGDAFILFLCSCCCRKLHRVFPSEAREKWAYTKGRAEASAALVPVCRGHGDRQRCDDQVQARYMRLKCCLCKVSFKIIWKISSLNVRSIAFINDDYDPRLISQGITPRTTIWRTETLSLVHSSWDCAMSSVWRTLLLSPLKIWYVYYFMWFRW